MSDDQALTNVINNLLKKTFTIKLHDVKRSTKVKSITKGLSSLYYELKNKFKIACLLEYSDDDGDYDL